MWVWRRMSAPHRRGACLSPSPLPPLLASPLRNDLDELTAGSVPRAAMPAGSTVARPMAVCFRGVETSVPPAPPPPSRSRAWETLSPSCQARQMEGWQRLLSSVPFHEHILNTSSLWGHKAVGCPGLALLGWEEDSAHVLSI